MFIMRTIILIPIQIFASVVLENQTEKGKSILKRLKIADTSSLAPCEAPLRFSFSFNLIWLKFRTTTYKTLQQHTTPPGSRHWRSFVFCQVLNTQEVEVCSPPATDGVRCFFSGKTKKTMMTWEQHLRCIYNYNQWLPVPVPVLVVFLSFSR